MQIQRRYNFKNILNCRDLGGYPTPDGVTKFSRFIRCGIVNTPEQWEIDKLNEIGISTSIDLRGTYEVGETPLKLDRLNGADVYNLPLFEFNVATKEGMNLPLAQIYAEIADHQMHNIARVLNTIAYAKDGTIMYNCFFGKDRTGILTMLILSIAGVSKEDIVADYQQTYTYIKPYILTHSDVLWDANSEKHYSLPETMEELINRIEANHGSILGYIKAAGVSEEAIKKIRKKLCE